MRLCSASKIVLFSAMASLAISCSKEPTTFSPNKIDSFSVDSEDSYQQSSKLLQADYMFVLDTGFSMFNNKAVVQDSLLDFAQTLKSNKVDYQIGLVNGNIHGSNDTVTTSFIGGSFIESGLSTSLEAQITAQIFPVGLALNQHREVLLEATRQTLGRNASFIRNGSSLVIVFISDEDDESNVFYSNSSESDYISYIQSKKTPALIKGRAVVKGINSGCSVNSNQNEEAGSRLANVAVGIDAISTNRVNVSRCADDSFDDILQDLAVDVSKPTDVFALQGSTPDISTLQVFLNGKLQKQGSHYELQANTVVFKTKPASSDSVLIRYQSKYILSSRPLESSINVVVNGASLGQDAGNGWTYDASENRIVFHGSALPSNGSDIQVSYTVN